MKSVEMQFVNELGNEIEIRIEGKGERVRVFAAGPDSEVDHTWTVREAQVLGVLLTDLLEQMGAWSR